MHAPPQPDSGAAFTIQQASAEPSSCWLGALLGKITPALDWPQPLHEAAADIPVQRVDWLQDAATPTIAVAGSAAMQWLHGLSRTARDALLARWQSDGLHCVIGVSADGGQLTDWFAPHRVAVATTSEAIEDLLLRLRQHCIEQTAPVTSVYGGFMEVFGLGVLITGPAGIGKSELALELLARGHRLVADDAVEVRRFPPGLLVGRAPELLRGFLEVRGLGVLDVAQMYGEDALLQHSRLDFLLELRPLQDAPIDYRARLTGLRGTNRLLDLPLPAICLPVRVGHNLATLVEAACRDQWLRQAGHCADEQFALRQRRAIDAQAQAPEEDEEDSTT